MRQTIRIHPAAPIKPEDGQPCNGCGVCCAAEPCPLSLALLRHRDGSCPALLWSGDQSRYVCGLAADPLTYLPWLPRLSRPLFSRLARRWIAAGSGCDFDAEVLANDA
jgi:hypothetical protein